MDFFKIYQEANQRWIFYRLLKKQVNRSIYFVSYLSDMDFRFYITTLDDKVKGIEITQEEYEREFISFINKIKENIIEIKKIICPYCKMEIEDWDYYNDEYYDSHLDQTDDFQCPKCEKLFKIKCIKEDFEIMRSFEITKIE